MATIQTKIALRRDDLSNWNTVSSQVLNAGEIAIVVDENGNENLKIGNGISSFGQLPYMYANAFTSKSISQGLQVKSSPTSLAAGAYLEADGNFNVVNGIQAHAKSGDDYAYVFNGDIQSSVLTSRYESHGTGTFNINPVGDANGFYIGEKSLSSLMSESSTKVNAGIYGTELSALESLSVVKIAAEDYYALVANEQTREDVLYILSSDDINAYDGKVINVAAPIDAKDAANKQYVDKTVADTAAKTEAKIPLSTSQLANDSKYMSSVAWNDVSATAPAMLQLTGNVDQRISVAAGHSIYVVAADAQDMARVDLTGGYVQLSGAKSGTSFIAGAYVDVNQDGRIEINENAFINCANGFEQICAYVSTDSTKAKVNGHMSVPPSGTTPINLVQFIDSKKYYPLVTAELQVSGDALSCSVQDHAVTTIEISSATTPVIVQMPAKSQYGARDFILRVEVSSSTAPSFTFMGFDETISFDSDSDDWMTIEPGLNLISFTETK